MTPGLSLSHERWANLSFTEGGRVRLREVEALLDNLLSRGEPGAESVLEEFLERMRYLNDYGGTISDTEPRRRFRLTLDRDFAPLSFTLTWEAYDRSLYDYRFSFQGALVWHGGSEDPLCVSLTPQLWGIHT